MLLEKCKNKKITFILGAGASLPFITDGKKYLSTQYLTEQISDRIRWSNIYNEFKQTYPAGRYPELNFQVTLDEILEVINKLKDINELEIPPRLQNHVSVPIPDKIIDYYGVGNINFEHILYLIDKICNYKDDRKSSIDNILFNILYDNDIKRDQRGWHYVPFLCREVLISSIIDLWESCDKEKAIQDNQKFLTSILENFQNVSIYSLNYDPLLYESTKLINVNNFKNLGDVKNEDDKTFETGFNNDESFNYKKFYYRNNVIAFLHGHIGFIPQEMRNMCYNSNYQYAQNVRISNVAHGQVSFCRKGPKGIHHNVSITSGLEKLDSFYDNPYSCYIQRFSKDVMESDYIVFIGSGLGDMHVNLFVTTSWMVVNGVADDIDNCCGLWMRPDEQRKIIIVTEQNAPKNLSDLSMTDFGRSLYGIFKEGISSGEEAFGSLKENGYSNINRDIFLYLKGTKQFFSEIWDISDLF